MLQSNASLGVRMAAWRLLPVVSIDSVAEALGVAEACARAGLPAIEITLRSPAALDAIGALVQRRYPLEIGAGTVLEVAQMEAARRAGAAFAVSPGCMPELLEASTSLGMPCLPGVATASEIMLARRHGFHTLKFFPAGTSGGAPALRQLAAAFPDVRFCPTGGIDERSMKDYLALPAVVCVGGSWIADRHAISHADWAGIELRARDALAAAVLP